MSDTKPQLTLSIQSADDAETLAGLGRQLRQAVLAVNGVTEAEFASLPTEENTRPGLVIDWTTLLVALASSGALTAVVTTVQMWLLRNQGRTVKLKLGDDELELSGLSREEQENTIQMWLNRQHGLILPYDR